MAETSKLKQALLKINDAVEDLSSLHVQTLTGRIKLDGELNYSTIEAAVKNLDAHAEVTLVAESLYKFDGDSYNFLTSDTVPDAALALHESSVESGLKTRQGLIEMFKDLF